MTAGQPWATLRITLDPAPTELSSLVQAADLLEELGAMIASDPLVTGVEIRDPTTADAPDRPQLWAYTVPDAVEPLRREALALGQRLGLRLALRASIHHDDSWRDAWKSFHRPIVLGERQLLLRPSWLERRPQDPELEVVLDPGRAFGTGLHASTRLCLDHLCSMAAQTGRTPSSVLDLGCGSGILALSAARLWPTRVVAVDNDPEATATARENRALNLLEDRIETMTGALAELPRAGVFDLVVANIRPSVLVPLASEMAARLMPGGTAMLAGVLDEEHDEVAAAYEAAGLVQRARRSLDGWCLLEVGERP